MQKPTSLQLFLKNNFNLMNTKYPFLSQSQIKARLKSEWKKEKNNWEIMKSKHKIGNFNSGNVFFPSGVLNFKRYETPASMLKSKKWNQARTGQVLHLKNNHNDISSLKTSQYLFFILSTLDFLSKIKQNKKYMLQNFSSEAKNNTFDLSDSLDEDTFNSEVTGEENQLSLTDQLTNIQNTCSKLYPFDKNNHFNLIEKQKVHKEREFFTSFPVKQSKLKRTGNVQSKKSLKKQKIKSFQKEHVYKTSHKEVQNQINRELNATISDITTPDKNKSNSEIKCEDYDDEETFNKFYNEDDDDDGVLLIRRYNSFTSSLDQPLEMGYSTDSSHAGQQTANSFSGNKMNAGIDNQLELKKIALNLNNKKEINLTPKRHSQIFKRGRNKFGKGLQKILTIDKIEQNTREIAENNPKCYKEDETIKNNNVRFFGAYNNTNRQSLLGYRNSKLCVKKAFHQEFNCRSVTKNIETTNLNEILTASTKRNVLPSRAQFTSRRIFQDNENMSPGKDISSDRADFKDEDQGIFNSQLDFSQKTNNFSEDNPIINHMFDTLETEHSRRLLASSKVETPSNFKKLYTEEEDIFL